MMVERGEKNAGVKIAGRRVDIYSHRREKERKRIGGLREWV